MQGERSEEKTDKTVGAMLKSYLLNFLKNCCLFSCRYALEKVMYSSTGMIGCLPTDTMQILLCGCVDVVDVITQP